nr:immunoglobulin heavy chain junction region [Macaca mulatta]
CSKVTFRNSLYW